MNREQSVIRMAGQLDAALRSAILPFEGNLNEAMAALRSYQNAWIARALTERASADTSAGT